MEPDKDQIFLIMDHSETDLKNYLSGLTENSKFTENEMAKIMYNTLCAMNFIHSANIIHRDIKPANLLIDSQFNVKICDFGLSRTDPTPLKDHTGPRSKEEKKAIA